MARYSDKLEGGTDRQRPTAGSSLGAKEGGEATAVSRLDLNCDYRCAHQGER